MLPVLGPYRSSIIEFDTFQIRRGESSMFASPLLNSVMFKLPESVDGAPMSRQVYSCLW
jgi:hypothetical protein